MKQRHDNVGTTTIMRKQSTNILQNSTTVLFVTVVFGKSFFYVLLLTL